MASCRANLALLAIPLSYNNPRSMKYYGQTAAVLIFILYLNALSIFQTWITQGKVGILGATLIHECSGRGSDHLPVLSPNDDKSRAF